MLLQKLITMPITQNIVIISFRGLSPGKVTPNQSFTTGISGTSSTPSVPQ